MNTGLSFVSGKKGKVYIVGRVSFEVLKMMFTKLESLLDELFVTNIEIVGVNFPILISPINFECKEEKGKIERHLEFINQHAKEFYESLTEVIAAVEKDGGITEQTYEKHKYVINSFARDMADLRIGAGAEYCFTFEKEDRAGGKATPKQIARFPKDRSPDEFHDGGRYDCEEYANVFSVEKPGFGHEGTLFQTEYDAQGNLRLFRIFHQGHRNSLDVRAVDVPKMIKEIKRYVRDYDHETEQFTWKLPISQEKYLRKIEEFNSELREYVRLNIITENELTAEFKENPKELGEKLAGLDDSLELDTSDPNYIKIRKGKEKICLFLERELCDIDAKPFDPDEDKDKHTVILPYKSPEIAYQMIRTYILAKVRNNE